MTNISQPRRTSTAPANPQNRDRDEGGGDPAADNVTVNRDGLRRHPGRRQPPRTPDLHRTFCGLFERGRRGLTIVEMPDIA
jgi:hypothetical protein